MKTPAKKIPKKRDVKPLASEDAAGLTDGHAPVPDEKPVVVAVDDVADEEAAARDEKEREDAYNGVYFWKGKELLPFTPSKKALWERLCLHDVPMPEMVELGSLQLYMPRAAKLLYLLANGPETYRHLRANPGIFIEAIEAWQDANMVVEDDVEAVSLALTISNAASKNIAVPKPTRGGRGAGE